MEDRNINWYLDKAKEKNGFKSDLALNRAMGFKGSVISMLRNGKTSLSDDKMIELARLAGVDDLIALMDLHIMKADNDDTRAAYTQILKRISCILIPVLISISPAPAFASVKNACDSYEKVVYIMGNNILD